MIRKPAIAIKGPPKPHRDARLFCIACEGEQTEFQYFHFDFLKNSQVKIHVIPTRNGLSAPNYVRQNLCDYVKKNRIHAGDQLWLVVDRDKWPQSQLDAIRNQRIRNTAIQVAMSNPCFELFLYLHLEQMPQKPISNSHEMEKMLRKKLGWYSKVRLDESNYVNSFLVAVARGEMTKHGSDGFPLNPGTDVGKIVKEIISLKPKKE